MTAGRTSVVEHTFATPGTLSRWSAASTRAYPHAVLEEEPVPPRPVDRFARTTAGLVISASLLGLRDVLEGPHDDEPAIVQELSGEPQSPTAVSMRLDPDNLSDSIVLVRPWLMSKRERGTG